MFTLGTSAKGLSAKCLRSHWQNLKLYRFAGVVRQVAGATPEGGLFSFFNFYYFFKRQKVFFISLYTKSDDLHSM